MVTPHLHSQRRFAHLAHPFEFEGDPALTHIDECGAALTANALGSGPNLRNAAQIESYLVDSIALFDVDGDGSVLPHTDGLMILRRLLNPNAIGAMSAAEQAAITANAKLGSLTDAQVLQRIEALKP
jgi:hypothetical protein